MRASGGSATDLLQIRETAAPEIDVLCLACLPNWTLSSLKVRQASAGGGRRAAAPPNWVGRETGMLLSTAGRTGETVYSLLSGTSQTIRGIWLLAAPAFEDSKESA
ncbi:uncharacterized protein LOC144303392 [Canis aureus]